MNSRTVIVTIEHHIEMMQARVMMNLIQIAVVHMLASLVLNHLTMMMVQKVENVLEILLKIRPHQKLKNQNVKLSTILMMMKMMEVKSPKTILTKTLIQIIILIRIRIIKTETALVPLCDIKKAIGVISRDVSQSDNLNIEFDESDRDVIFAFLLL